LNKGKARSSDLNTYDRKGIISPHENKAVDTASTKNIIPTPISTENTIANIVLPKKTCFLSLPEVTSWFMVLSGKSPAHIKPVTKHGQKAANTAIKLDTYTSIPEVPNSS
jgi:hypothetical protein